VASHEIDMNRLVDPRKQKQILNALENYKKEEGLAAVKNSLPDDISFADIKFVLAGKTAAENL
jgi:hypothetical protein